MGNEETYKKFDGYDPASFYGTKEENESKEVKNFAIDKLSELLNRIQDRAY